MPEQQPENLIDQFWKVVEQLLLPNWSNLILLLPWVLIGLVVLWLLFTSFQWRRAGPINRSRVPQRRRGGAPPAGIHMLPSIQSGNHSGAMSTRAAPLSRRWRRRRR